MQKFGISPIHSRLTIKICENTFWTCKKTWVPVTKMADQLKNSSVRAGGRVFRWPQNDTIIDKSLSRYAHFAANA